MTRIVLKIEGVGVEVAVQVQAEKEEDTVSPMVD
jgi:hypothetical protein